MQLSDIKKLAHTARIAISDEEAEGLSKDLEATLAYIEQLNKAPIPEESTVVPDNHNVTRDDVVTTVPGSYTTAMLAQAVGGQDGFVKVKKIL